MEKKNSQAGPRISKKEALDFEASQELNAQPGEDSGALEQERDDLREKRSRVPFEMDWV